jgi:hypothetical protein
LRGLDIGAVAGQYTSSINHELGRHYSQASPKAHEVATQQRRGLIAAHGGKTSTTIDNKLDGEQELTIVDPIDNIDEVQAELNAAALVE